MMRRLLASFALLVAIGAGPAATVKPGVYRATIALPGAELPFGLEISRTAKGPRAALVNGAHRFIAERTTISGDTLTLDFPSYDSSLELKARADGRLTGTAHLRRRDGGIDLPMAATPGQRHRFYARPAPAAVPLSGRWLIQTENERGVLLLTQAGNRLTGSIQWPSGDQRYLAGEVSGRDFALSTFDGNQGSVWKGRVEEGRLAGASFNASSAKPNPWTARRQGAAPADAVAAIGHETALPRDFDFTFPDTNGKPVSLNDPRYRDKVVIVTIGGTWCPNCHDEAAFLAPYYLKNRARGLEVIGLQFEYIDDPARSARQNKRFAARYNIPYPLLIAGASTPESTKKALPQLGGVKVYPTTIFIDRKGKIRAIHTGYAGPATGALNKKMERDFDALVRKLLAERA